MLKLKLSGIEYLDPSGYLAWSFGKRAPFQGLLLFYVATPKLQRRRAAPP
jgi:hypothetical protein